MMNQVDEFKEVRAKIALQQMIDGVSGEKRKQTDQAVLYAARREEAKVSRIAEETVVVNDQLNQKLKTTVGEAEIAKLISGKSISAKTRAVVAKELGGAIDVLWAQKEEIAGSNPTGSNKFEQNIATASFQGNSDWYSER
jgi:hypothetical protein